MWKKILNFIIGLAIFFNALSIWAHPPSSIDLNYDQEKELLEIEVYHRSYDVLEHRIRKILVDQNGQTIQKFSFVRQPSTKNLKQELSLKAESKDVITVKAICNEAGYQEETLLIP